MSSRTRGALLAVAILAVGALAPAAARAQCAAGTLDTDGVLSLIDHLVDPQTADPDDLPRTTPEAKQVSAPTSSGESPGLVDGTSATSLLAAALDNDLVDVSKGKATVSLNAFAFVAAVRPEVLDLQSEYERYTSSRRWAGSLTFGGEGEALDQDGDGEVDEARTAQELDDQVTWDATYRLWGSRDRRDKANYEAFFAKIDRSSAAFAAARAAIVSKITRAVPPDANGCFPRDRVEQFVTSDEGNLERLATLTMEHDDAVKTALDYIDNSLVLTLALSGTEREEDLGPDKLGAGLRLSWRKLTANLDWARIEGLGGADDPTTLRLAAQYSWLWLEGSLLAPDGVEVALDGSYERFDHVPTASNDTISKVNAKLELPVTDGIKLPISITWANHKDLITDESELRGHIGFSIDTAEILKRFGGDDG